MIKIQRVPAPHELTNSVKDALTEEFSKETKKAVWDKPYIRKSLLEMSHRKCCYCECLIGVGNNEMHIDHFKPKHLYPNLVVEWDNLMPSCSHCNKSKGKHDPGKEHIINPTMDNPHDYLYIKNYRYYATDKSYSSIGQTTISVLNLNDNRSNVPYRYNIGNALLQKIEEAYEYASEHEQQLSMNSRFKNRVLNYCRDILMEGIPTAECSALMATLIHTDDSYLKLKELLERNQLWDEKLERLHCESLKIKFSYCKGEI